MCSCFDTHMESKSEIALPKEVGRPSQSFNKGKVQEIPGFDYSEISKMITTAKSNFTELINEGVTGYDVIFDKDNCKVYSKEAVDGYILKYTWNIPFSAKAFIDFMDNVDSRKNWDKNIEYIQVLGNYSDTETIITTKYKKFLTFDPRETLAYSNATTINGNLATVSFSVESDHYPIINKVVRVKLFVAGLYTESIEPDVDGNFTKITCVSHMDVGLPKGLNNIARKFAGTTVPPITKKIVSEMKKQSE